MTQERTGDRIRRYRRLRNMTQAQLADLAGTDRGYIGKLEAGGKKSGIEEPSIDVVIRIAKALGVPVRALADPRLYETEPVVDWLPYLMADRRFDDGLKGALAEIIRRELARDTEPHPPAGQPAPR